MRAKMAVAALVAALVTTLMPGAGADFALPPRLDPGVLDGSSPRAIVRFSHNVRARDIDRLASARITEAAVFEAIDAVAVLGPLDAYVELARWRDVLEVRRDAPIDFYNYVARGDTGVDKVREGARPLKTGYDGTGVTVVVVDSGVDTTHPDLTNVVTNVNMEPSWFMDDITDGAYSESAAEQPVGTDEFGHGTHVAGIVGGTGAIGVNVDQTGVAPGATLINCKIGLSPAAFADAFETDALACYDWILAHRKDERFPGGIRVATNSWALGTDLNPPGPLVLMLRKVVAQGISVVFAAGNSGPDEATVSEYPNSMEEVVTVGAICKSDADEPTCEPGEVANFSSRGKEVDVAAPGVSIWSARANGALGALAVVPSTGSRPGDPDPVAATRNQLWYMPASGTSMATPFVAGVVALMVDANPRLTPARIEALLTRTATDRGAKGFDHDYGFGVVDAFAAVRGALRAR